MIKTIVNLLSIDEFEGRSKKIDFAKGSNELTLNLKKAYKQHKRKSKWL